MLIYTCVWGEEYLGYFERGLAASFKWPKNAEALTGSKWIICCQDEAHRPRIEAAIAGLPVTHEFISMELYDGVKHAVRIAFKQKRQFLMAPPDNVFSDGSLANFKRVASQKTTCVATAHVRALPSFLDDVDKHRSPSEMVTHAWKHLHGSWTFSERGIGDSATHQGGVYFQALDAHTLAVQHRLPTIFLSNLTNEDLEYFLSQIHLGIWDNLWPPILLINQQRYRYLGSSEAGFVVEITHPTRNVPARLPANTEEPDSFYGNSLHNWVNRLFVSVFKASEPIWTPN